MDASCNNRPYVLITGASSGVGRAVAVSLSNEYNLVIHGRNIEKLHETKALCDELNSIELWQCDFMLIEGVEESLRAFLEHTGIRVAGYVHSAGMVEMLPLRAISLERIQSMLNTNFLSAAIISKLLVQKKVNGSELKNIVFISSNISKRGGKAFASYAASKGALDSFMRCIAVELAPKVRVNSILPGAMRTEMTASMFEDKEMISRMEATYPLGMGISEDIAGVAKFLLSNEARWITGQQITVDGGRTIDITG